MSEFEDFVWTDGLVNAFCKKFHDNPKWDSGITTMNVSNDFMEAFKASKQPKPEWEILEGINGNPTIGVRPWVKEGNKSGQHPCVKLGCKIHSVKSLSDGEVFTVGDEFCVTHQPGDHWTIDRFEIGPEGDMRLISSEATGGYNWGLKIARGYTSPKLIPVLLTPSEIEKLKNLLNG